MTQPQLTDLQLEQLLRQAPPPAPPAADLAERIAARASTTPQERTGRFAIPRRHGPRRGRHVVLSSVIAANVLAAAAAAASWDGERFDFHRIADIPHRVAAAIHRHRHPHEPVQVAHARPHVAPKAAPAAPPLAKAPAFATVTPPIALRARMMPLARSPISPAPHHPFGGFQRMPARPLLNMRPHQVERLARAVPAEPRLAEPKHPRWAERRQAERAPLAEPTRRPAWREGARLGRWQRRIQAEQTQQAVQDRPVIERPMVEKPLAEKPMVERPAQPQPQPQAREPEQQPPQREGQWRRGQRGQRWRQWQERPRRGGPFGRRRGF